MQTVRCGLIGYGAWGQHHARAIDACPDARLVAIAAHTKRNYEVSRRQYPQARVYSDYREMLAAEELDLCSVAVPSDRHFEVAQDVLGSGRHLLLEKPMALSVDDCVALVRLAESRGRVLAVGHELRLSSLWGKVKELVDAGAVGDVQCVSIDLWRHPYRQGIGRWRYDPARVGDWVLEEPIHFFDLARWYFSGAGEPVSVYAAVSGPNPQTPALFDNFTATVRFPCGRYAVITQTLNAWEHHQTAKLTGTDGAILASWGGRTARTTEATYSLKLQRGRADPEFPENATLEDVPVDAPSGELFELQAQVAAVVRAVRDGTPAPCTGKDGLWSVAMCLKAAESARTGRPVSFDPK